MDKQTTLGFLLIGLVLIVWMWVQAPPPQPAQKKSTADSLQTSTEELGNPQKKIVKEPEHQATTSPASPQDYGRFFSAQATGDERIVVIKTDLYTAEITTRGGLIRKWELALFKTWNNYPVHLVDYTKGGDLSLLFTSSDGKLINTRDLFFNAEYPNWTTVELSEADSVTLSLTLPAGDGRSIVKQMTFRNGTYGVETEFLFNKTQDVIANFEYQVIWETGLPYAEHNSVDESHFAMAYALSGGELTEVDAADAGEVPKKDFSGSTNWVAARTKYFAVAMIPVDGPAQGAYMVGHRTNQPDQGVKEAYSLALKLPYRGQARESARILVYLGPLDFDIIQSMGKGLDQIMSLGWAFVIRPISEYIMLPLFKFLRWIIPNYGFVIIVFSLIIKIALHPLTKTSMKSMRQMQALQPLMTEIREKHKDDPQKMNHAIMNLYKDYGVNPASGCLPMLMQMPILFALYSVFNSAIELRQASFIWWITDLSIPDTIFTLPFTIPFVGITAVSGLALAMGVTMFLQQKMTVTDPRQKAMVWMMPVMLTLLFNNFPSGLNLYYFVFNLFSIVQQKLFNKQHANEPLRKVEKKKSRFGVMDKLTKDLPKLR